MFFGFLECRNLFLRIFKPLYMLEQGAYFSELTPAPTLTFLNESVQSV
jgi:hypothetical protein